MEPRAPSYRLWSIGGAVMAVVGFTAALVEILNYLELKPRDLARLAAAPPPGAVATGAPAGEGRAPSTGAPRVVSFRPDRPEGLLEARAGVAGGYDPARPARIVVVVKNQGDMRALARASDRLARGLLDADRVSLVAFADGRAAEVFRDRPGDEARVDLPARVRMLFAARRVRPGAAVAEGLERLRRAAEPGMNAAVVLLSEESDREGVTDGILEQVRGEAARVPCVVAAGPDLEASR